MIKLKDGHSCFYATSGSAAFDIASTEDVVLEPGEFKMISTELYLEEDSDYVNEMLREVSRQALLILPRSGLAAKRGLTVLNAPGLVDEDYRQEIKVVLINLSKMPQCINKGDRIAQGMVIAYERPKNVLVKDVVRTGGFGSTNI